MQGRAELLFPNIKVLGNVAPAVLRPQLVTEKQVKIKNDGEIPVMVRVNLEEVLLTMAVDTADLSGNGNLKKSPLVEGEKVMLQERVVTWQVGSRLQSSDGTNYYTAEKKEVYPYRKNMLQRPAELAELALDWGTIDPEVPPTSGYWMYLEQAGVGYYYYSDILEVGDETTILLKTATLGSEASNKVKGSLYHLSVNVAAGQATKGIYGEWALPNNSPIYQRYEKILTE